MTDLRVFRIAKIDDQSLIRFFTWVKSSYDVKPENYFVIGRFPLAVSEIDSISKSEKITYQIQEADLQVGTQPLDILFRRNISRLEHDIHQREPSPYYNEIILKLGQNNNNNTQLTQKQIRDIIQAIDTLSPSIPISGSSTAFEPKELLVAQISTISGLHQKMIADSLELRKQLEAERRELHAANLKEAAKLRSEVEAEKNQSAEDLSLKRKALDDEKKELDDRAYTFARREDRRRITTEIQNRLRGPGLSRSVINQRRLLGCVLSLGVVSLTAAGYMAAVELENISSAISESASNISTPYFTNLYWAALARLGISSTGAIGIFLYLVQWLRKVYIEDSHSERELERYAFDLNRASWAIETILEAKKENGQTPPRAWIDGACKNLFQLDKDGRGEEGSAMDAFADLLRVAAEAKVGTDGASISFNNRGTKKIAKSKD